MAADVLTPCLILAEREGFEPSIGSPLYSLSKRAPSASRPSLPNDAVYRSTDGGVVASAVFETRNGSISESLAHVAIRLSRSHVGGGGGIRTPGAFAQRFSRPSPSTARPLLPDESGRDH